LKEFSYLTQIDKPRNTDILILKVEVQRWDFILFLRREISALKKIGSSIF
jgi:hypothetical protein